MGEYGEKLEENIGAVFKPTHSDWEKTKTAIELAFALGEEIPVLGIAIKAVAFGRAWYADGKKAERATSVIQGLYERLKTLEGGQKEYLRKDEAQAMLEEAFARIADQPDESRREDLRRILHNLLAEPGDLSENRLFLRLADELPTPALKLLNATHGRVTETILSKTKVLASLAGLKEGEVRPWVHFLATQGLFDEEQLNVTQHRTFEGFLTPLGVDFEKYRRG